MNASAFQALEGVKLRLERVVCFCNPKYCKWIECNIKFISRQVANLNMIANINRKITAANYTFKLYYKFSNNEYRPILMDLTADYCTKQPGVSALKLMNVLSTMWGNNTNIFQPCPFLPGEYYVKNWNFAASDLPSVVPAGRYLLNVTVRTESNDVFNSSTYFYIANYGILDLNMG